MTILIVKAFELAKEEDLKFLKYAYGNHSLTNQEVEKVREIMKITGALDYSQKLSRKLVEKAKKFIPQITKNPKYQKLLSELADFCIERKS